MDWLRSEDLKEEKNVTTPIVIIAVHALCRFEEAAGRTIGHAPNECRVFGRRSCFCSYVAADVLLRDEPHEDEEDEEEHDGGEAIS